MKEKGRERKYFLTVSYLNACDFMSAGALHGNGRGDECQGNAIIMYYSRSWKKKLVVAQVAAIETAF